MRFYLRYPIFIFAALFFGGSVGAGASLANSSKTLVITGTGSGIGTMQAMARAFETKHADVHVKVLPSIGSTGGIKALRDDKIDIGLSYRPLKPEERSVEIVEEPYSRTAFVFGVQDSNPATDITLAEIEEMYARKRTTWPDGKPVRLVLRPVSDGFSVFLAGIRPGLKSASEKAHSIPGVMVGMTDQEAAAQIESTPGSFGTTSSAVIASEKRKIKALSLDGVAPTLSNVSDGKYPYAMTLYLLYKQEKYNNVLKDFIDFVFSREGQGILADNGHVTLDRITGK